MNVKSLDAIILRYVGFGILFVGVAVMLYLVRGVLPVFIVGGVVAYAAEPLLQRLEKNGRSRPRAVGFVFGIYVLIVLILFSLLATAFQQGESLVTTAPAQFRKVSELVRTNQEKLQKLPLLPDVREAINKAISSSTTSLSSEGPVWVRDHIPTVVSATGGFLVSAFLITLISFGLMLEAQSIKGRLLMVIPPVYRRDVIRLSASINELLGRYVRGQLIVCGTFGTLCTITFEILYHVYGMQYPLVLGGMAACLYVLPYFGLAIVLVTSTLTAYLTATPGHNIQCAAIVAGCCIAFNLLMDYGISPRVLGRGVGLHPLMVIFALLCGFELGGPIGTLAAVPIFASLRVIFIYLFPQLAAPLPDSSPEATSQGKPHSATTEMSQRVANAESDAAEENLLVHSRKS